MAASRVGASRKPDIRCRISDLQSIILRMPIAHISDRRFPIFEYDFNSF